MGWSTGALLGFDTETTGVDTAAARIVTVALVRRADGVTTPQTWLVDPGVEIPAASTAIHGITTDHAREHGRPPAEVLEAVASQLAEALQAHVPVVAFNASYDLTLIEAELARHALPSLAERVDGPIRPVVDPLVLDRAVDRYRKGKRTLTDVCAVYGVVPGGGGLHTADVDVVATLDVLAAIVDRYPELAAMDPDELHEFQATAHRRWAENFNAWRASKGLGGPGAGLGWPLR